MSSYNSPNKHWEDYQKLRKGKKKRPKDWDSYRKDNLKERNYSKRVYDA